MKIRQRRFPDSSRSRPPFRIPGQISDPDASIPHRKLSTISSALPLLHAAGCNAGINSGSASKYAAYPDSGREPLVAPKRQFAKFQDFDVDALRCQRMRYVGLRILVWQPREAIVWKHCNREVTGPATYGNVIGKELLFVPRLASAETTVRAPFQTHVANRTVDGNLIL